MQRQAHKRKLSSITIDSDDISSDEDAIYLTSAEVNNIFELKNSNLFDKKEIVGGGLADPGKVKLHCKSINDISIGILILKFLDEVDSLRQQGFSDEPLFNIVNNCKYIADIHFVPTASD